MASPPQEFGLSLPSRRANVTVTRRTSIHSDEGEDSVAPLGRDSLEGTRRYYNLDATSNPSGTASPRLRTTSNNSPRPMSASPSESSFSLRSPPRGQVPLPVPRGFLAPQKPAAARRLETRERSTTVSTSGRVSTDVRQAESEVPTPVSTVNHGREREFAESGTLPESSTAPGAPGVGLGISGSEMRRSGSLGRAAASAGTSASAGGTAARAAAAVSRFNAQPAPVTPTRPLPDSISEARWERNTETSSPSGHGHHHPDLSSDHLVELGVVAEEKDRRRAARRRAARQRVPSSKATAPEDELSEAFTRTHVRNHTRIEGTSSKWFCGGHLMTGGDSPLSFILSVIIVLGISGVWLATTGAWLWSHGHHYGLPKGAGVAITIVFVYLFGLTVSSMIAAAFRDPGILPRGLDPDPPYQSVDIYWEAATREIFVGEGGKDRVPVKYCETCKSYRPPRCSHCRLCGNCVEGIDHHCAYIHGCVGRRNYFAFLVFVISAAISDIYIVIFSALHFSMMCQHDHISFKEALEEMPGAAVSFLLGILVLPPILFLLYYHVRLLLFNLTTIEQIRASASSNLFRATQRPYNPFAAPSRWRNVLLSSVARPQMPSWINASGYAVDDNRRVNPALTTPEKYLELV